MNGASWAISCAAVFTLALCLILLRHYTHLHPMAHPVLVRLAIAGAYIAGCAIALTVLGSYVESFLTWLLHPVGGQHGNGGHLAIEITGAALFASVAVAIAKVPRPQAAYLAAFVPFILVLAGGWEHSLLTIFPAEHIVQEISRKVGG